MKEETSLALPSNSELYRQATDVAGLCRDIAIKSSCEIQKRKYVKVEGWMAIATAHGCIASIKSVTQTADGVAAVAELKQISTGNALATAEGFVGADEPTWYGGEVESYGKTKILPKRPDYAIRAMAQTRAISRVCRSAFAHVVVMMDAGLSTTPAEEVPMGGFNDAETTVQRDPKADAAFAAQHTKVTPVATPVAKTEPKNVTPAPAVAPQVPRDPIPTVSIDPTKWDDVEIHFGKNKGTKLNELENASLCWYIDKWQPKPYNGKFIQEDIDLRAALDEAGLFLDKQ